METFANRFGLASKEQREHDEAVAATGCAAYTPPGGPSVAEIAARAVTGRLPAAPVATVMPSSLGATAASAAPVRPSVSASSVPRAAQHATQVSLPPANIVGAPAQSTRVIDTAGIYARFNGTAAPNGADAMLSRANHPAQGILIDTAAIYARRNGISKEAWSSRPRLKSLAGLNEFAAAIYARANGAPPSAAADRPRLTSLAGLNDFASAIYTRKKPESSSRREAQKSRDPFEANPTAANAAKPSSFGALASSIYARRTATGRA